MQQAAIGSEQHMRGMQQAVSATGINQHTNRKKTRQL
jgi:hypothetical protein